MADTPKVYTPEVVPDAGFPLQGTPVTAVTSSTQETANKTYSAKEMVEQGFPARMIAKELLSTAINTVTKKITKAFQFTKSGALQIGEYVNGVSGDVRISPDGITARNSSGNTTFSIDGDSGNAFFVGEVRANDFVISDERGLISLANFGTSEVVSANINQTISASEPVWTMLTGSRLNFYLNRRSLVAISLKTTFFPADNSTSTLRDNLLGIELDGHTPGGELRKSRIWFRNITYTVTGSCFINVTLDPGMHTVSAVAAFNFDTGTPTYTVYNYYLSYIVYGS